MSISPLRVGGFRSFCLMATAVLLPHWGFTQTYDLTIIEPIDPISCPDLESSALTRILKSLNDHGQSIGHMQASTTGRIAYRRNASGGIDNLDPNGDCNSQADFLNESGQVLGRIYGSGGIGLQKGVFRYTDGLGSELLTTGVTPLIEAEFHPRGMNNSGTVIGIVFDPLGEIIPYRYTDAAGWEDLRFLDPAFMGESVVPQLLNDSGDIAFVLAQTGGIQIASVVDSAGTIGDLNFPGSDVSVPGAINASGEIAGSYRPGGATASRAYVYTPAMGVMDIHDHAVYETSSGQFMAPDGRAMGILALDDFNPARAVFVWDAINGMQELVSESDIETLAGGVFSGIELQDANDDLEFVFQLTDLFGDSHAAASTSQGLIALQPLVDSLSSETLQIDSVDDINSRGDILLDVTALDRPGEPSVVVLLRPAGGALEFIRGDGDGNGVINGLVDGVYLLRHQFVPGSPAPPCFDAADLDDDGALSGLVDGLYVLNFQFVAGSPPPPAPYPQCGTDPTPDALGCDAPPCP